MSEHAIPAGAGVRTPGRRVTWAGVRAWTATWAREAIPFLAITVLALVLRLIQLDAKAMHHDESEHAWFAWQLIRGNGYHYDPVFHGPVQFYLIAFVDLLLGAGDYVARLPVALVGTTAVFLPFFVRRQLGTLAALTASVALCLSPAFLYQSRFAREDIHIATVNLALLVVLIRFLHSPGRWQPLAFLSLLAVAFATKETTYITVFVLGLFFAGALLLQALRARRSGRSVLDGELVRAVRAQGAAAWAWGASAFLVLYTVLFSTFFTNPGGVREGLVGSIDYWLSQQPVGRGGQPWFYYSILIPAYEWPIVLLGVVGIVAVLRRPTMIGALILWVFVSTLAVFSWASERMPWLMIHPLLPLVLLAGIGLQTLWEARRRRTAMVALAAAAVLAIGWVTASIRLSYFHPADARELLVQVQSSQDVPKVRDEIVRLTSLAAKEGHPIVPQVDSWGGTGWPWSWYLRDVPTFYHDMSQPEDLKPGPIVLVADPNYEEMKSKLRGYEARRFTLRVWWVADWGSAGVRDWVRWALFRKAWSPTATMDEWIYLSPEAQRLAAQQR